MDSDETDETTGLPQSPLLAAQPLRIDESREGSQDQVELQPPDPTWHPTQRGRHHSLERHSTSN